MSFAQKDIEKQSVNKNTFHCWTYSKKFIITHFFNILIFIREASHSLKTKWKHVVVLRCSQKHVNDQRKSRCVCVGLLWDVAGAYGLILQKPGGGKGRRKQEWWRENFHWLAMYTVLNQQNIICGDLIMSENS